LAATLALLNMSEDAVCAERMSALLADIALARMLAAPTAATATNVCGLKLLVYAALKATSACGLKLIVYAVSSY
jgi:hypothetical protein